jgi:hypothetical protein
MFHETSAGKVQRLETRTLVDKIGIHMTISGPVKNKESPFYAILFNSPCHYVLLNLRPLIFVLTPFGWLRSLTVTSAHAVIHYETIIFYFRLFYFRPLLRNTTGAIITTRCRILRIEKLRCCTHWVSKCI